MPPELTTMAERPPRGRRPGRNASVISVRSSRLWQRTIPYRLHAAEKTSSSPASDPVCEMAWRLPISDRPSFTTMTGLSFSRALAAVSRNSFGRRIPSTMSRMILVSGSSMRKDR